MTLKPNLHRFFKFTCDGKYSQKDIDRFINHIDITPGLGPKGDCWEWSGTLSKEGYGFFCCRINNRRKNYLTHRMAIEITTNKLIPKGIYICHHCDNVKCVKSFIHLFMGTQKDNMRDMIAKGRKNTVMGEKNGSSKLTWEIVREIRKLWNTGKCTQQYLGKIFKVTHTCIGHIVRNKTWYDSDYIPYISTYHINKIPKQIEIYSD